MLLQSFCCWCDFIVWGSARAEYKRICNQCTLAIFVILLPIRQHSFKCQPNKIVPDVFNWMLLCERYWLVLWMWCGTYSGKSPSTRHIYCFCTWRFRIWCSIWRAFFGLRPNNKRPDVRRSKRWIVRKFFKLNSLARMKTTVLWR